MRKINTLLVIIGIHIAGYSLNATEFYTFSATNESQTAQEYALPQQVADRFGVNKISTNVLDTMHVENLIPSVPIAIGPPAWKGLFWEFASDIFGLSWLKKNNNFIIMYGKEKRSLIKDGKYKGANLLAIIETSIREQALSVFHQSNPNGSTKEFEAIINNVDELIDDMKLSEYIYAIRAMQDFSKSLEKNPAPSVLGGFYKNDTLILLNPSSSENKADIIIVVMSQKMINEIAKKANE